MKNRRLSAPILLLLTGSTIGCDGSHSQDGLGVPNDSNELTGTAEIALTNAPSDGTCIAVTAEGRRTVSKKFDVAPGASTVVAMRGLPLGQVAFSAQAFGGTCNEVTTDSVPNWTTEAPVSATVRVRPPVLVTLNLVHNGSALVSVGFDEDPDGSVGDGSAPPAPPDPGKAAFMSVTAITGESSTPGFVGAFDIQDLQLSAQFLGSTTTGGGAGSGKTVWSASAKLHVQKGSPELHLAAAAGTHLANVVLALANTAPSPFVFFRATLADAVIASIQTSVSRSDLPAETVTFTFSRIDLEYDQQNPDGTPGAVNTVSWDLVANRGSVSPVNAIDLELRVGGGPNGTDSITVASIDDASFTQPLAPSVLDDFVLTASGRRVPTLDAHISIPDDSGGFTAFGAYGFSNVTIHSVKLAALKATVGFGATASTWTVGQDTISFP